MRSLENFSRIRAWRAACPDLTIRSTFIAGFPGETDAEFDELLEFLRDAQLDRVGCFAYSPVDGAAANALPDPLPTAEREARRARLMQVQQEISQRRLLRKVGSLQKVLVDEVSDTGARARSTADAPEIDGVVHVAPDDRLKVGDFFQVRITAAGVHDLHAVIA